MTLVARITLGGAPFLIADALLSSENLANRYETGPECRLPFIGEINSRLAATGHSFRVSLCQKLHVFEGRLAVGWSSNDALQAERALKVLRDVAKKNDLTFDDVREALDAIVPEQIKDLKLIGLILRDVDGNQISASVFSHDAVTKEVSGFGEVRAAGSGVNTFIEVLRNGETTEPTATPANDPWVALGVLGSLLNHELSTGQSIEERWGGAYEAVSYSRQTSRLEKLDNVLHTFWSWRDGKLEFQTRFYFAKYFGELLALRSVEYEIAECKLNMRPLSDYVTLVPSQLRELRSEDRESIGHVEFSFDYICCHVWIHESGQKSPKGAIILAGPKGGDYDVEVSIAEDGSLLRLTIPSGTQENVLDAVNRQAETEFAR